MGVTVKLMEFLGTARIFLIDCNSDIEIEKVILGLDYISLRIFPSRWDPESEGLLYIVKTWLLDEMSHEGVTTHIDYSLYI